MPRTLAASALAALVLLALPGRAQPPGYQPNGNTQPQRGLLPLPPGYRPRTPPPQSASVPTPNTSTASGSGTVMYFQKPADALAAIGGPNSSASGVAQLNAPVRPPVVTAIPDAPASTLPPPPPASRYLPAPGNAPPVVSVPPAGAISMQPAQPQPGGMDMTTTAQKKQLQPIRPVPEEAVKLPPRERVFMVYDDLQLERAIMERLIQDRVVEVQKEISADLLSLKEKKDPKEIMALKQLIAGKEKNLRDYQAVLKNPLADPEYRFPPLPVLSPPGVAYQPKTSTYEPRQVIVEPGYVVHRRLHFEERNAERYGWDFGPMQTLVSAATFWKDVFLWPQSLASGCVSGFWDTSAGKCLPGSPVPYYLYPPGLTIPGSLAEAAIVTGTAFLLP